MEAHRPTVLCSGQLTPRVPENSIPLLGVSLPQVHLAREVGLMAFVSLPPPTELLSRPWELRGEGQPIHEAGGEGLEPLSFRGPHVQDEQQAVPRGSSGTLLTWPGLLPSCTVLQADSQSRRGNRDPEGAMGPPTETGSCALF